MVINDGKGHTQQVRCGLMDKEGAFFLLLKENKTRYYKFTTESDCIDTLVDQIDNLRRENSQLKKQLRDTRSKLEYAREKAANVGA